ncbi:phosphoribosyltransferase [Paraburkholderia phymatum]|uniref:Phosphoribosyltransferase n=1 Tax=Paraburkholderia phymatum (strain DSM 17167 / CIP 108236 / LMG 21445 / STM815) TaxID=391038 RepID=B2JTZ2_PARP8|nr:phosphoribosyltransferase [Paraburkholderia phymatum]ACC76045.1 phosphoribosyltransferase [Paraburkholderia phymatum STM815]
MSDLFQNRTDAGKQLAALLERYAGRNDVVVLALPRGGVPVGYEVAQALRCPFDVLLVRKLGTPHNPELAMGAIATGDAIYLNESVLRAVPVSEEQLLEAIARERIELDRRESAYRGRLPPAAVEDKTVIVVDDGMATGSTMHAALNALRTRHPKQIVVAVPVCPAGAEACFQSIADDFVCVMQPDWFMGIGQFYADFTQTGDEEVRTCLAAARDGQQNAGSGNGARVSSPEGDPD